MTQDVDQLRRDVARACRKLGVTGLTTPLLGHVGVRIDEGPAHVRCRGPQERGLLFSTVDDIMAVPLDGPASLPDRWSTPHELPIARRSCMLGRTSPPCCTATRARHCWPGSRLPHPSGLRRVRHPAYLLAKAGVPVFGDSGLVSTAGADQALAAAMVRRRCTCCAAGGGHVRRNRRSGPRPPLGIRRAADRHGGPRPARRDTSRSVSDRLSNLGPAFTVDTLWRHHLGPLDLCGLVDVGAAGTTNDDGVIS